MSESLTKPLVPARQMSVRIFLCCLLFLSFFSYPLAIFPPSLQIGQTVFFNLAHTISFPATAILGLLALPLMIFFPWRFKPILMAAIILFAFMLLMHIPKKMEYFDSFLLLIGYVTIPIAAAILLKSGQLTLTKIAAWASCLWFVQIILACIALYRQSEPVGTPGNINWMAGLLLMLSPWVIYYFMQTAKRCIKNRLTSVLLPLLLFLIPTIFVLYQCHSRAAWLAAALLPVFFIIIRLPRLLHRTVLITTLLSAVLIGLTAAYIWFPAPLLRVVEKDVRLPLWTGTGVMIAKHPLGIGTGLYQKEFTPFRKVSSYQQRLYAADMTVHPHNELLNIGAQLGIPALLAFIIMISQIWRSPHRDPLQACARISAYFVIFLSMFDMLLVQVPTSFLGFFVLGLNWPVHGNALPDTLKETAPWIPGTIVTCLCTVAALVVAYIQISHNSYLRLGMIKEEVANSYNAPDRLDEKLALIKKAIGFYEKSLSPFNTIIPSYKIGRLSMRLPQHTEQAEAYLKRVAALDPDFSHLNLLFGQLSLQQQDLASAEHFFSRECAFYPRSEMAWQNMYTFVTGMGQYQHTISIDRHLRDIYRERARQNFGESGLVEKGISFADSLNQMNPAESIELANQLLDRISNNFTDPLFLELSMGMTWPSSLFTHGFNGLDMATWRLRSSLVQTMEEEIGSLPVSLNALVLWYKRTIQIHKDAVLTAPETVWRQKAGNPLSVYMLFTMLSEMNQTPSIICLDNDGEPEHAYLFAKESAGNNNAIFRVNLLTSSCTAVSPADFKRDFHWTVGQTLVYYPLIDFFLRNQILATVADETFPHHPQHPPSVRLLQLFALTTTPAPPLSMAKQYCFSEHIRRYNKAIKQLDRIPNKQPLPQ